MTSFTILFQALLIGQATVFAFQKQYVSSFLAIQKHTFLRESRNCAPETYRTLRMGIFPNPVEAIQKFFKGDKKNDSQKELVRREEQKRFDSAIDNFLKDAPFPAKIAGELIKGVGGMVAGMAAETRNDVAEVLLEAERSLRLDSEAVDLLGTEIRCGAPFSQSYSSTSINGKVSKQIILQVPVQGTKGAGTASISAVAGFDGNIVLNNLSLRTSSFSRNIGMSSPEDLTNSRTQARPQRDESRSSANIIDAEIVED